jgi:two-component system, LytTR family, response regulator
MSNNSNQMEQNLHETIELCPKLQRKQPIYIEEIAWLEGFGNYTMIHFKNGQQMLTSKTLGLFDKKLPKEVFVRVNRSFLVRIKEVSVYKSDSRKYLLLVLHNGQQVEVSRRKKSLVKKHLLQTS